MPSGLKRYHFLGHDHFITFTRYYRFPYLDDEASRTIFEQTLESLRHPSLDETLIVYIIS